MIQNRGGMGNQDDGKLRNGRTGPRRFTAGELIDEFPHLQEPIVGGLLRRGEVGSIVASPKVGKTWLVYSLALSVVCGDDWLGRFPCTPGRVLIVDLELHAATIASRIKTVATAMALQRGDYADRLEFLPLRGQINVTLDAVDRHLQGVTPGEFDLLILDSWYRVLPDGVSESDHAAITRMYNQINVLAARLDLAWCHVHHASKGSQAEKDVVDVGSGAGSQSRAPDCHAVLRPHEDEGVSVFEAAVRSWPKPDPLPLRWVFPRWLPDGTVDASKLKGLRTKGEDRQRERDTEGVQEVLAAIPLGKTVSLRRIRDRTGFGEQRVNRLIAMLKKDGEVQEKVGKYKGRKTRAFCR